jgi:fatty-acyl-CoA synthase
VGRGDRVAVLSENRVEYVELFVAAAKLGAIAACLNWRQAAAELAWCVQLVEPRLALVSSRYRAAFAPVEAGVPVIGFDEGYETALAAARNAPPDADPQPEDGLVILYTSGTTGLPKGALVSQRAMVAREVILRADRGLDGEDAFVAWSPLFHMGAVDPVLGTLMRGGKVIVMDGFDAVRLAGIVAGERIGHLTVVPGTVDALIDALKRQGVKPAGVKAAGAMADLVPPHRLAELTALLGAPYCNTFGSTETGPTPACRALLPPGIVPTRLAKQQSSLCELRLVDSEGRDVADGEPGEAWVRTPALFSGYWAAPEANAEAFAGGWYRMGDVLVRNPDGTLDFVDRRKYLIKSGGENIYPAEIERALLASPRIAEAVVVRRPDVRWGEVPVAFVVPADAALTPEDVLAACRGRIAAYKLPKEVRFVASGDLPRNASGKVERRQLEALVR